jgi:hypothetical protein
MPTFRLQLQMTATVSNLLNVEVQIATPIDGWR